MGEALQGWLDQSLVARGKTEEPRRRPRVALDPESVAPLDRLLDEPLEGPDKTLPLDSQATIRTVGGLGWNIFAGDVPLPTLVVNAPAIRHNIDLMQSYADANGVLLAPHGKATMSPQIWAEQLEAGAWAITLATAAQLQVASAFGLPRVMLANEPVTAFEFRLIARELAAGRELYVLVDDARSINHLAAGLRSAGAARPLSVLIELGIPGGRTGARSIDDIDALAMKIAGEGALRLGGLEVFEGTASLLAPDHPVEGVDAVLRQVAVASHRLAAAIRPGSDQPFIVSAGGSGFVDRVTAVLHDSLPPGTRVVMRPGTYVTHDVGMYDELSPFGSNPSARLPGARLRPALTLWSAVLSRPEPELVLLNIGRRDSAADADAPRPLWHIPYGDALPLRDRGPARLDPPASIVAANDQHMYMRVAPDSRIGPGDLIGCGISHPCLAMDRWRTLLIAQDDGSVTGAIRTFF